MPTVPSIGRPPIPRSPVPLVSQPGAGERAGIGHNRGPGMGFMRDSASPFLFGWQAALREPADEYREAFVTANARAIDAMHNSGWLAGGIEYATSQMCGPMLTLNLKTDPSVFGGDAKRTSAWARDVERRYEAWARNPYSCDIRGVQNLGQQCAQAVKMWFGTGEILALVRYRMRPGNSHGTKMQVLPPTRLPQAARDPRAVQGVILDRDGFPTLYCINSFSPQQPGVQTETQVQGRDRWGRLVVVHIHDSPATVVRGISPLAPALKIVRQYDQLANATLQAALIQAIFAATIQSDAPTEEMARALQAEDEQTGQVANPIDALLTAKAEWYSKTKFDFGQAGKVTHLYPSEELKFLRSEHPNSNYKPFSRGLLMEVARCLGLTYEGFTGDREGATYSSERMGSAEAWLVTKYRRTNIPGRFMQASFEAWLEEDIELGNTSLPGGIEQLYAQRDLICRADWRGPPRPSADELKTARANEIKKKNGIITREMWSADEDADWQDIDEQRLREQQNEADLELDPPDPEVKIAQQVADAPPPAAPTSPPAGPRGALTPPGAAADALQDLRDAVSTGDLPAARAALDDLETLEA